MTVSSLGRRARRWLSAFALVTASTAGAAPLVHHAIAVDIQPARSSIEVVDKITLPAPQSTLEFTLHRAFLPALLDTAGRIEAIGSDGGDAHATRYRVVLDDPESVLSIAYGGPFAGGPDPSAGHVGPQGVYLNRHASWYPDLGGATHQFSLAVTLPSGWEAVSQGIRQTWPDDTGNTVFWSEGSAQDDIYLIAGPLHRFSRDGELAEAQVYLRSNDAADADTAEHYLAATERYLSLYSHLLGPYPYRKFALVENFWESGYGMPSFTLLGPRVLRLPFIIYTSYPHEIVHNWFGNGVYIDYSQGNWSEGLTAYLSDHLMKELRDDGAAYRRDAMQKYRSYVDQAHEFPLSAFVAKHGDASEAIGYNKTLMLFHMLRRELGDETFVNALRRFYDDHRFTHASYDDVRAAFEDVSGRSLERFFDQWLNRTGAPTLAVSETTTTESGDGFELSVTLEQRQCAPPYELTVSVVMQTASSVQVADVVMANRRMTFTTWLAERPLRIHVDPWFDVFRRLDASEIPVSLGDVFGSSEVTAILPAAADESTRESLQALARNLGATSVELDTGVQAMPDTGAVWLLGWDNTLLESLRQPVADGGGVLAGASVSLRGREWSRDSHCLVLTARLDGTDVGWIGCDEPQAMPGLARKLPHYGKYSYLAFDGVAPDNRLKGNWSSTGSVMVVDLLDSAPALVLPARPKLTEVE